LFTAFFGFSAFYFYTFADLPGLKRNQSGHFIFLSAVLFCAGLLFWPTIITLPGILLVYEFSKKERLSLRKIFLRILPFAVLAAAIAAVNLYISYLRNSAGEQYAIFDNGLIFAPNLFAIESVYKIPALIADYIIYCFVPPFFDIIFAPPLPPFTAAPFIYISKCIVLAAFLAACFVLCKKNKIYLMAAAITVFFLLPGITVVYKNELISLRYMYAASAGIFFIAALFVRHFSPVFTTGYKKWFFLFPLILFAVFSFSNTFSRKYLWKNPETVTNSMLVNGNIAEVWGWFLKINWETDMNVNRLYLMKADEALEKNRSGYELQYPLIKQNITGRIEYVNAVLASLGKLSKEADR
jgi:hypothetical protein